MSSLSSFSRGPLLKNTRWSFLPGYSSFSAPLSQTLYDSIAYPCDPAADKTCTSAGSQGSRYQFGSFSADVTPFSTSLNNVLLSYKFACPTASAVSNYYGLDNVVLARTT